MPKLRQIAINNNAGAFTDIFATIPVRFLEISEDEGTTPQGLQIKSLLDNFDKTNVFSAAAEPITIPNAQHYPNMGALLGVPAQNTGQFNAVAATKLISVRTNGAAASVLRIIENE